jgi:hypothetical protein
MSPRESNVQVCQNGSGPETVALLPAVFGLVAQELLEVQARFSRDSESYRRHWSSTGEPLAPWVSAI